MNATNEYDRAGRCIHHRHIQLRKRRAFVPGTGIVLKWRVALERCPHCVLDGMLAEDIALSKRKCRGGARSGESCQSTEKACRKTCGTNNDDTASTSPPSSQGSVDLEPPRSVSPIAMTSRYDAARGATTFTSKTVTFRGADPPSSSPVASYYTTHQEAKFRRAHSDCPPTSKASSPPQSRLEYLCDLDNDASLQSLSEGSSYLPTPRAVGCGNSTKRIHAENEGEASNVVYGLRRFSDLEERRRS